MWSTSTDVQVWLLDADAVGHGFLTSTGGFALPLELGDRIFAVDPMEFGSVGKGKTTVSWLVVPST